ncbi:MAG: hypothetical protein O7B30_06845 [Thaumarchaeota archaeon]|nr:hypothetical protein [Nitrososphaerota archaeon]
MLAGLVLSVPSQQSELDRYIGEVRAGTMKYRDPAVALAAGYQASEVCVAKEGIHFIKPGFTRLINLEVGELTPEFLIYAPSDDGNLRLVGVEYYSVALANTEVGQAPWFEENPPPLGWARPPPVLYLDKVFQGPISGHTFGDPWHYELHAYVWDSNPEGVFSRDNPNIVCPNPVSHDHEEDMNEEHMHEEDLVEEEMVGGS